jgi:predicted DNA-binding transcriptional regulator YafY
MAMRSRVGADVEVLAPPALRSQVRERLAAAAAKYGGN